MNMHSRTGLLADDTLTGKALHLGTTMYVDDISDIKIITKDSMINTADSRSNALNQVLSEMDMAQNTDKEEHLRVTQGIGSVKDSQALIKEADDRGRH